jgi:carbon monoxide dehydrogenase subunit G
VKLENEFTVNASMEDAWEAMNDLERVTPCLPGAQLTEQVGDEYKGEMSVKMGPVTAKYNGTVKIEEADDSAHRAVIRAEGKDARGQGTASATISSTLHRHAAYRKGRPVRQGHAQRRSGEGHGSVLRVPGEGTLLEGDVRA